MRLMLWGVAVLASWCVSAHATVLIPADLSDLAHDAQVVVRGRVVAVSPQWTDDRRAIESRVSLEVESYLKGDLGPTVTFRVPGGRLGRFQSLLVGAPVFTVDQHVVVFLGHRGPSVPHLLGLGQGVYRVTASAHGWIVTPPGTVSAANVSGAVVRGDRERRPLPLGDFERRLQGVIDMQPTRVRASRVGGAQHARRDAGAAAVDQRR